MAVVDKVLRDTSIYEAWCVRHRISTTAPIALDYFQPYRCRLWRWQIKYFSFIHLRVVVVRKALLYCARVYKGSPILYPPTATPGGDAATATGNLIYSLSRSCASDTR